MFVNKAVHYSEFKNAIESTLKMEMIIPFDPQLVPVNKPNFYVYRSDKSGYTLTAHLFNGKGISKKIDKYYYELNVSNNSNSKASVYTYNALINRPKFIKRLNAQYILVGPKNPEQQGVVVNR
ncbi:MAG: hypothetical protein KUG79_08735 [Pseudomonadales bacterium]|nr:hypothetical protein [Pseudomonadales bacterium]